MTVTSPNYQYPQDVPSFQGDRGTLALGVRTDADRQPWSDTNGDFAPFQVNARGELRVAVDSVRQRASYSAVATFTAASSATDIFTISGSDTKTVRVSRITVYGTRTTAGLVTLQLLKRGTANTGGTSSNANRVRRDAADDGGTAVVKSYTANPTLGSLIGQVDGAIALIPAVGGAVGVDVVRFECVESDKQPTLYTAAQSLCVNLGGVTVTGNSFVCIAEWTEE